MHIWRKQGVVLIALIGLLAAVLCVSLAVGQVDIPLSALFHTVLA